MVNYLNPSEVAHELGRLDAEYALLETDIAKTFLNASHDPMILRRMERKLKRLAKTIQQIKQQSLL